MNDSGATRGFPLTPQQQRHWHPDRVATDRCVLTLRGPLDEAALRRALEAVAARHSALVTRLARRPGLKHPLQSPEPPHAPEWCGAEAVGEAGAPLAARLERIGPDEHRLELSVAATSSDARSLEVLVRDLLAFHAGEAPGGEEPVQFLEIAQWLRSLERDEDAAEAERHWRDRLAAADARRPLPFAETAIDPLAEVSVAAAPVAVSSETAGALEALAGSSGLSVPVLLSGAWRALLWWLGERSAAAVAEVVDGRPFEELEGSVGRFALPVAVPVAPSAGEGFLDLCRRIESGRAEAAETQEFYAALRDRWADDEPRAVVDVARFPAAFSHGPLEARVESVRVATEPVPLALAGVVTDAAWDLELRYDERVYDRPRAERLAGLLTDLLGAVAEDAGRPVGAVTRLAAGHPLASVLEGRRRPAGESSQSLPERVAAQAERWPDRPAVQAGERVSTFARLRRETVRIARLLESHGIGSEDVVAVCVLDPLDLAPALLGVLEAGAAYLPVDPTYPEERIALTCRDAGARVMLTGGDPEVTGAIAAAGGLDALRLDAAPGEGAEVGREPFAPAPESLAYVLYTSGSTGTPKGVMVPHGALAAYLDWCAARYGAGEGSGSVVHSPLGFDLTVTSLFGPLAAGRRVFFTPLEQRVEGLAELMRRERDLSLIKLTPSQLRLLERFLPEGEAEGRARAAVIGGETLRGEHLAYWRSHAPSMKLINEYGPTETVVGCAVYEVGPVGRSGQADAAGDSGEPGGGVPIGTPIDGALIALVDRALGPVPRGLPGEIAIGGDGVSRGYLGRPARTAESFVPDPFADRPGARLYRSGDLAVLGEDGSLRFLGRNDRQVKLRGFRVELGEIEAVTARHPRVGQAVAVVRTDDRGDTRLVVYAVPADGEEAAVADLTAWARRHLPDHMVPSAFVAVDAIPLTAHGKVDEDALPEPEKGRPDLAVDYAPPENRLQNRIVEIWQEVLQMDEVGIHDNFFDLGGHSYLMFEVHRRLSGSLDSSLSMVRLFQHPTVHALAQFLSNDDGGPESFEESERRGEDRRASMSRQRRNRRERKLAQS